MRYKFYDPNEYLDQLTDVEKERFYTFNHDKRKSEFVATRILRHDVFGFEHIHYDPHGAPYIEKEGYISISHAPGLVGIALSPEFKVGLDLEPMRNKAFKLKSKFLSENEKINLNIESENEMTKVWSAKEVLYKLAGRKRIHFKTELLVEKVSNEKWKGRIINPGETLLVDLSIFEWNNHIISVNTEPIITE